MARAKQIRMVSVTCGSLAEARKIARAVVEGKVAGCVNIFTAPVESIYRWKGKIEKASEFLLLMKTSRAQLKALERAVKRLHSYETPEFLAIQVSAGESGYVDWLMNALSGPRKLRKKEPIRGTAGPDRGRR